MLATTNTTALPEGTVLLIEAADHSLECEATMLRELGILVESVSGNAAATEYVREHVCPCAVVALQDEKARREIVEAVKRVSPDTEIVVFSDDEDSGAPSEALKELIFDCLPFGSGGELLARTVHHAARRRQALLQGRAMMAEVETEFGRLQRQVAAAKRVLERRLSSSPAFIGESEAIAKIRQFVAEIAPSDQCILIRGESGTGKDIIARLIHEWSGRNVNVFLKISCSPLSEVLLLSELFGHESVMLTGGEKRRPGRFEQAADGTVFLDEIGETPLAIQDKMLHAIQDREFTRVGGNERIHMDCRLLVSTCISLEDQVFSGRFRSDLYDQLREHSVVLPTLRQRSEDIPLLVRHFLSKYGAKFARPGMDISSAALSALMQYDWPGNVRELESVIKRYVSSGTEDTIFSSADHSSVLPAKPVSLFVPLAGENRLRDTEIQTIVNALAKSRWNQRRAAKMLGVSYSALRRRIAKYDLKNRPMTSI